MADTPINVAYPVAEDLRLRIALGACRFKARSSDSEAWVSGTCYDPTDRRSPRILEEGGEVTITEPEPSFERIPASSAAFPATNSGSARGVLSRSPSRPGRASSTSTLAACPYVG